MDRTYTFIFDPDPEGGFVVTCPALAGLVIRGRSLEEARKLAQRALDGLIAVLIEYGEPVPESDPPEMVFRCDRLTQSLRDESQSAMLQQITTRTHAGA